MDYDQVNGTERVDVLIAHEGGVNQPRFFPAVWSGKLH